jgi:hypothetical protein
MEEPHVTVSRSLRRKIRSQVSDMRVDFELNNTMSSGQIVTTHGSLQVTSYLELVMLNSIISAALEAIKNETETKDVSADGLAGVGEDLPEAERS